MHLNKKIIYISGLPHAGSILLCQLFGLHPDIYSPSHSSSLAPLLEESRNFLNSSPLFLSQLDADFDLAYQRLINTNQAIMNGWFEEADSLFVVDSSSHWVNTVETLSLIDPNFKMVVCLRDLTEVYGSLEKQHTETRLLNFPDPVSSNHYQTRLDDFFKNDGVIGKPLKSIQNLQHLEGEEIKNRICYIDYDALTHKPESVMRNLYQWLDMPSFAFNPNKLPTKPYEYTHHDQFKYSHKPHEQVTPPTPHIIPKQIKTAIYKHSPWFYEAFYPEKFEQLTRTKPV